MMMHGTMKINFRRCLRSKNVMLCVCVCVCVCVWILHPSVRVRRSITDVPLLRRIFMNFCTRVLYKNLSGNGESRENRLCVCVCVCGWRLRPSVRVRRSITDEPLLRRIFMNFRTRVLYKNLSRNGDSRENRLRDGHYKKGKGHPRKFHEGPDSGVEV